MADVNSDDRGPFTVFCSCITGKKDCPYCKGTGTVVVRLIGEPYPTE